jgi:hypothetical protein
MQLFSMLDREEVDSRRTAVEIQEAHHRRNSSSALLRGEAAGIRFADMRAVDHDRHDA